LREEKVQKKYPRSWSISIRSRRANQSRTKPDEIGTSCKNPAYPKKRCRNQRDQSQPVREGRRLKKRDVLIAPNAEKRKGKNVEPKPTTLWEGP